MKYIIIKAFDCPDAWTQALWQIWTNGDTFKVGYGSEETETKKLNLSIEIQHPENRPLLSDKAPCDEKYLMGYFASYLWMPKEPNNTSAYTYGDRLRLPIDQIDLAIERLIAEPNDRQVTLVIRRPEDICKFFPTLDKTDVVIRHDPPCLTFLDLEIFDNQLHLTGYFRSWDAYAGLPANVAGLQLFSEQMVKEINPHIDSPLTTGKIILHSKNCHIYKRQYELVEQMFAQPEHRIKMYKPCPKCGKKIEIGQECGCNNG